MIFSRSAHAALLPGFIIVVSATTSFLLHRTIEQADFVIRENKTDVA